MPYFKNEKGVRGYVNDEEVMARLEKKGLIRLEGRQLFLHLVVKALKDWGIPAVVSVMVFHFTGEFALSLIAFWVTQQLLD